MKGAALLLTGIVLLFASACSSPGAHAGHGTPTPSRSADRGAAAWHKCGATQIPPGKVLNAQLPMSTQILWASDISPDTARHVAKAYGRTNAFLNWAINENQLSFLQGACVAAPLSHTEDNDISLTRAARAAGGHAEFDPESQPTKIAIRAVPRSVADKVQLRINVRPDFAAIVVAPGTTAWIVDQSGRHIKKYAESDHNSLYINITVGTVADDGIGMRFVQQWQYSCSDPEVVGLCDGV